MKRTKIAAEEREAAFLRDIVIEAADVEEFTRGIAEATKNLTPALEGRHSKVPWNQVAAFRDFSAHHYWEMDYSIIWDIVREHLPPLLTAVKAELEGRRPKT
jgi:uncharacterized protein with HEPN domain